MLTNFTEMVDGFPEKVDRRRAFFPLREIHKSGRFDCPGAGLGESDKSFLRYRRLRDLFSRCARSINLVDLFLWDCPGTGLGESDKSFLRYR